MVNRKVRKKHVGRVLFMKLGVIIGQKENMEEQFVRVAELGVETCQVSCWNGALVSPQAGEAMKRAAANAGVEISAIWAGWPGPKAWNLTEGPLTLGLVPRAYRHRREEAIIAGAKMAEAAGVEHVATHVGFIPEDPNDPVYKEVVVSVRSIAQALKASGQSFLFETGQETPVTLLRTIADVGTDNLGVNLDPANLLMYGKANPVDAVELFGSYIKGVHVKDGEYPTCGTRLGRERAVGEGRVNFPLFIAKLKEQGYAGPLTIEREISGEQQRIDILKAIDLLRSLIAQ